eukprot:CAMPEP_0195307026 /NCGR_PEP_ID=MMETSP0707-20130614/37503_1 /TAXON_ID=33640 /ORGANISM="Asterionellopsis glacialis, Strain CCMP134" /LENGTH=691 /DNA_ID=CAMNT_0040371263 /DNA_START=117 /DNA_END=2192 /DNA_ORIENTATION=+
MSSEDDIESLKQVGLNELQTLLRDAVQKEDYIQAGAFSDELASRLWQNKQNPPQTAEEKRLSRRRMSWIGLGGAPWLVDRLDSLNFTFPTTIQINAMDAVNSILNIFSSSTYKDEILSLEERMDQSASKDDMGIVVSGNTGSGKTLSYLVPLLSTLSDSLFVRQRLRVGAEENVGDKTDDMLARIAVVTSPQMRSTARKQIVPNKGSPVSTGAAIQSLGKSGENVKDPLALIVVPTRELGIQTAMLLYELVGGKIKKEATEMSGAANMFKYKGPKGIKIGCILDDDEAEYGLKLQTDIAITMPKYLTKLLQDKDVNPSRLRVIAYDEADLALEQTNADDLDSLFDDDPEERDYSRLTFLVGASVTESLGNLAVRSRVLPEGKSYISTATRCAPLMQQHLNDAGEEGSKMLVGSHPDMATLKDLGVCLDPGLKHQRVIVPSGSGGKKSGLLILARLLRKELRKYEEAVQAAVAANVEEDKLPPRPRVVVFFPSEEEAKKSTDVVRDAIWGDHQLCVLLPNTGIRPLSMMEQFKEGKMSVMLATPNSVRGLDFPALTHVYTLYLPVDDPREYVHLAGRVGRVGQMGSKLGGGGRVVSILKEGTEAEQMEGLAEELGFEFEDVADVQEDDTIKRTNEGDVDLSENSLEDMRRYLEDTVSLIDLDEESEQMNPDADFIDVSVEYDDNDDEEGAFQ